MENDHCLRDRIQVRSSVDRVCSESTDYCERDHVPLFRKSNVSGDRLRGYAEYGPPLGWELIVSSNPKSAAGAGPLCALDLRHSLRIPSRTPAPGYRATAWSGPRLAGGPASAGPAVANRIENVISQRQSCGSDRPLRVSRTHKLMVRQSFFRAVQMVQTFRQYSCLE